MPGPGLTNGTLGFSARLGLFYRILAFPSGLTPPKPGEPDVTARTLDSTLLIRIDLATRTVDTIGRLSSGNQSVTTLSGDGGGVSSGGPALFPFYDDAVVTSDGSLAILRAQEYRLEWINPDATHASGPRIPFPWRRIADDDRKHILDSVNARRTYVYDSVLAKRAADSARTGAVPTTINLSVGPDGERTQRQVPSPPPHRPVLAISEEVPDFFPPTGRNAVMADADDNVWICPKPALPAATCTVWDVVNRRGELTDRVRIPDGRTLVGFGSGGAVYLMTRDAGVASLERARSRKPSCRRGAESQRPVIRT